MAISTSYASQAEGDTYFGGKLYTEAWDNATSTEKDKSLIQATRIIDRLNFKGSKTDDDQELQFPRDDDSAIPDNIKSACCEIAYALLDGVDPELEFENLSMVSQGYANVRSTYDRQAPAEHLVAGVPSVTAWRYLLPYLRDTRAVDLSRAN